MRSRVKCLIFCLIAPAIFASCSFAVVFVDQNAPGPGHDGATWDTAFLAIQEGVDAATPSGEVWVADAVYVENVVMGEGVQLYGGFLGAEPGGYEDSLDQRDYVNNVATIDGNQSGSCVVMAVDARVDGFTVTNGSGTPAGPGRYGGGFFCLTLFESGVIANNTIVGNSAAHGGGGGIYCNYSSPTVINNTIPENSGADGGGIYCYFRSSPAIVSNVIRHNSAEWGAGVRCLGESSPTLANNAIHDNSGNGVRSTGACSPELSGNTIYGNSDIGVRITGESSPLILSNAVWGNWGGGVDCGSGTSAALANNTIYGNLGEGIHCGGGSSVAMTNNTVYANVGPGVICARDSSAVISNNIVACNLRHGFYCEYRSSVTLSHNDVWRNWEWDYEGCEPGEGDISADPEFVDPGAGDFHLTMRSPCMDAGWNEAPALPEHDFEGDPRVFDGDGDQIATVDIGADEIAMLGVVTIIDSPIDDVAIAEETAVEFTGTAYHTGGLDIVGYLWTFGEGSGIDDIHVEDPGEVVFSEPGTFIVTFDAQAEDESWSQHPDNRAITVVPRGQELVYVDRHSPGPEHDGTSWDTAYLTIQEGVAAATAGGDVWVADGVYVENVVMGVAVRLYGGFLGAEPGGYEDSLDQRDFVNNITAIDGNEAASCVVMAVSARLDGLTITNGSGTLDEYNNTHGGGVCCLDLGETGTITNNTIVDNSASLGGGISCDDSSPAITNNAVAGNSGREGGGIYCHFSSAAIANNTIIHNSSYFGGGIHCKGSSPSVADNTISGNAAETLGASICYFASSGTVANNTITGNSAEYGGGMFYYKSPLTVFANAFTENSATQGGGAIYCSNSSGVIVSNTITQNAASSSGGGGIGCWVASPTIANNVLTGNSARRGAALYCSASSPTVTNNTVADNSAEYGGGILCGWSSFPVVANNIVTQNSAGAYGGGICCEEDSFASLSHNDFWGNTPDDYYGCDPGVGDISADPMFVDPENGDYHLLPESPCIDAGWNDAPGLPEEDFEGDPRIIWAMRFPVPYWPHPGYVDIGADEYVPAKGLWLPTPGRGRSLSPLLSSGSSAGATR